MMNYAVISHFVRILIYKIYSDKIFIIGFTFYNIFTVNYDFSVFLTNNTVDDVSLILSMKPETDERIAAESDKLRRKYEW